MTFGQQALILLAIGVVVGGIYAWRVVPQGAKALTLTIWPAIGYLWATYSC